jgi:hypothetical protein
MKFRLGSRFGKARGVWLIAGALWIGASVSGLALLAIYDNSPTGNQQAPPHWPTASHIVLSEPGATLILFAHPRCPCTRASLGELEKIVADCRGSVTPWVVFFKPAGSQDDWEQTDLLKTAAAIPGAHVVRDLDGEEARRFHAMISGQTLLYSNQGDLLFSGGITFARGHSGDNDGRTAIESYLTGGTQGSRHTPVFGCPIDVRPEQK